MWFFEILPKSVRDAHRFWVSIIIVLTNLPIVSTYSLMQYFYFLKQKHINTKSQIAYLFFFLFFWNVSKGQTLPINFSTTTVTTDDGLSQGSNYFRFEDSEGFIWITGNDAINRYDGNYVKVYKKDHYFEGCKNLQQGYGFVEDDKHNIYIGSTSGLYVYVRAKDRFNLKYIVPKDKDQTVFPIGFSDGKIWCHNKDLNLIAYDIKTNKSTIYLTASNYKVSSFHIYDNHESPILARLPFLDNDNNVWVVNPNGLLFFNKKTTTTHHYLEKYLKDKALKILISCYDKQTNTILIGTGSSLLIFDCKTASIHEKWKSARVEAIATNKKMIVIKSKAGFDIYNKNFEEIYHQELDEKLATSYCYSFDKMDRLWLCHDGVGQTILDFNPPFLNKVASTAQFLKVGVGCITEFPDGQYLIQHDIVFDKAKRHFEEIKEVKTKVFSYTKNVSDIKNNLIWQISQDVENNIWIHQIGINKKRKFYARIDNATQTGLMQDALLLNDQLLCSFQDGLYLMNLKTNTINKLANQVKKNCFKINKISKNRIIVSYLNQEATVYQLNENHQIITSKNILTGFQPFYFDEDTARQKIWVGTNNGILVLDTNFKIIKKIDANNNLAGTYIYGILLDDEGNCWTSHQRGLSYINTTKYNIVNFTKEDGIQDWDFNNRAYYKATDGTLFFGGMKGFNYFKPPLTQDNSVYKSKVYVNEILVNQSKLAANCNNDCISKLNLKSAKNNISIHAIVRNINKGKQTPIVYRINHSKWIYKDSDCTIDLVNLAPNKYKVELGVYDKFQNKPIVQKTLYITISAPFYYKAWFLILASFCFAGLVFGLIYRRRLAKQRTIFEQQLALEQQRNKITADLHDDIGSTLSSLQINSVVANKMLDKNPKGAQKLLETIELQSENIADKIGDIIWSMKPGKDEFMTISTRIKNFANDILGATTINYQLNIDPIIDTLITDISTRKNIVLITKEALNNAVKYSKATNVLIHLSIENNQLRLEITDDGIGFNTALIKGNGITNINKRITELNGKLEITSTPNNGTSIKATIPIIP